MPQQLRIPTHYYVYSDPPDRDGHETLHFVSGHRRVRLRGHSFREFNQEWARRVLRTSGIIIIVSDGWDRGDPALVGSETERLRHTASDR